ncbi:MAG: hypothetical protein JSS30_06120 [Verrucomicrobia bacterium]|nr:hypothetical protein [Verrucomicrobiota bacterium]
MDPKREEIERKRTKIIAWVATVAHILASPFFLLLSYLTIFFGDDPSIPSGILLLVTLLYFCIPLSVPITLYLIWSRYKRKKFKAARWHCFDTLWVFIFCIGVSELILILVEN